LLELDLSNNHSLTIKLAKQSTTNEKEKNYIDENVILVHLLHFDVES